MKLRLMGAELFSADGQKDMTKLMVAFRSFKYAPKKYDLKYITKLTAENWSFWVITQPLVVIPYCRFGTNCWSHLQG